jgi:hypothetical protein
VGKDKNDGGGGGGLSNKLSSLGDLVLAAQAPGAQVQPFWLTIYNNGGGVNVRYPAAVGMAFGMADIMTKLGCFSA